MARLRSFGFEGLNCTQGSSGEGLRGQSGAGGAIVSWSTAFPRSGARSCYCFSGTSSSLIAYADLYFSPVPAAGSTTLYFRAYMWFAQIPAAANQCIFDYWTTTHVGVFLTTGGKLRLTQGVTSPVQIGSDSAATVTLSGWHRIEVAVKINSGAADDYCELLFNGVSVASTTTATLATVFSNNFNFGWCDSSHANTGMTCYVDDVALNDATGASQNTWPGDGKIVMLLPISDNAVGTGWVDGDGAGTLFGSVDNVPPVGATVPANGTQIKNLTSTATGNYDANMATYTSAGITASDTVTAIVGYCTHSEAVTAGSKNGAVAIVSNPIGGAETTFAYGLDNDSSAMNNWADTFSTWRSSWTKGEGNPSVVLGSSPVMRVGKRTATAAEVDVCAMFLYVEYTSGAAPAATPHRLALTGVGH